MQRILLRAALFIAPGSAIWGLLPVIAANNLGLSSAGYGLLLGALGLGAVSGAFLLGRLRARFGQNVLLTAGAAGFAVASVVLAMVPNVVAVFLALVVGGASWLMSLSTLNASMQLSLPAWVRARGLSVYQLIFMGGQAIGSVVWGVLAGATSSSTSLLVAAALLVVCGLSSLWWPLHAKTSDLDLSPSSHWPEPTLVFEPEPLNGPVLVITSYRVAPADEEAFLSAMAVLGRSRQRTGASQWRLFRSIEHESTFAETFIVRSWGEHMHQHYIRPVPTACVRVARYTHSLVDLRLPLRWHTERYCRRVSFLSFETRAGWTALSAIEMERCVGTGFTSHHASWAHREAVRKEVLALAPAALPVLSVPSSIKATGRLLNLDPELTEVMFRGRVEPLFKLDAISPRTGQHTYKVQFRVRKPDRTSGRSLLFTITVDQNGPTIREHGADETGFITFTSMFDATTRSGEFGFARSRIVGQSVNAALPSIEFLNELHSPNVLQASSEFEDFSDYRVIQTKAGSFPPSVMEYLHSLAVLEARLQQPVLIPDLTTVTEGEVFDANEAAALMSGKTLRSLWTRLNWERPPSEAGGRRTGEIDVASYYQLVILGPLTVNVGETLLTLGTVQKSLLSARLTAQGDELTAVPFLTDAMDRTFDPLTPPPSPSSQRVMGKKLGLLADWLPKEDSDAPIHRYDLRAAAAGRSGRSDISERIEELLADEAKQ